MTYKFTNISIILIFLVAFLGCSKDKEDLTQIVIPPCDKSEIVINPQDGCDESAYPDLETSLYVLPFLPGSSYPTGLTNCSVSFHAAENPDQYAFDFNMPNNSAFFAIRDGTVVKVEEKRPNFNDSTSGNYVYVKHDDGTTALYYHSPPDGIYVDVGDTVEQGQQLGITGTSGLAGYPHLHLIVVEGDTAYPYHGIPISFKNVNPRHTVLKTNYDSYAACVF